MKKAMLLTFNVMFIPVYFSVGLLAFLATWIPLFPSRVGLANLRERMGTSYWRSHILLTRVFMQYFYYFVELIFIWPLGLTILDEKDDLHLYLKSLVEKYELGSNRGFILAGGHFGNIETCGTAISHAFVKLGKKCCVLAKPTKSKLLNRLFDWYRVSRNITVVMTSKSDLFKTMQEQILNGTSLGFVLDQKPKKGGVFVRFMGECAAFPFHGPNIGMKAAFPVVHIAAQRILPGHFRIRYAEGHNVHLAAYRNQGRTEGNSLCPANEICSPNSNETPSEIEEVLAGYVGWLEGLVRESPTQWFWDYRKWSRRR